jgi:ribosomal protein L16 Arg81 hydroxylase
MPDLHSVILERKLAGELDETLVERLEQQGFSRDDAVDQLMSAVRGCITSERKLAKRVRKLEGLLEILRELRTLAPTDQPIDRCADLSAEAFLESYYSKNRPVVLSGLTRNWPALKLWSPEYFKEFVGEAEVEVMTRRNADPNFEVNRDEHRTKVTMAEYVDMIHTCAPNEVYMTAHNRALHEPKMRRLFDDFHFFPGILDASQIDPHLQTLWFGPKGTFTPLHHDAKNILMCQIHGRKRVSLIPALEIHLVYNSLVSYSEVDFRAPDMKRFPEFSKASVIEVILNPGDTLFLPVYWWHYVESLDTSITITFSNFAFKNRFVSYNP